MSAKPDTSSPQIERLQLRDRRRERPQLSCSFCRRRKLKCDRRLPCQTCTSRGIATACSYTSGTHEPARENVGQRIKNLEQLVTSLVHQQQTRGPSQIGASSSSAQTVHVRAVDTGTVALDSPTPSSAVIKDESNTGKIHTHGSGYVNEVHWAAILGSITELKDEYDYERELESHDLSTEPTPAAPTSGSGPVGPLLLYPPVHATKHDILLSLPLRAEMDSRISAYMSFQGLIPPILHRTQFLRQYNQFWEDPPSASIQYLGLLFSIMLLSTGGLPSSSPSPSPETTQARTRMYAERCVQCLILGKYTSGGPHVLETLIHYLISELLGRESRSSGPWFLIGVISQLALNQGYHREPSHLPHFTVFEAEMRRRVWATAMQLDGRISSELGQPLILAPQKSDTRPPSNLFDWEFDEDTTVLPPSRPESELTPVLYGLVRNQVDTVGAEITALISDPQPPSQDQISQLETKLAEAQRCMPARFQWKGLNEDPSTPAPLLVSKFFFRLAIIRPRIWLQRRNLHASMSSVPALERARDACLDAALSMLEMQAWLEVQSGGNEGAQFVHGLLAVRSQSIFLLAMSVVCYVLRLELRRRDVPIQAGLRARMDAVIEELWPVWEKNSLASSDVRRVFELLTSFKRPFEQPTMASSNGTDPFVDMWEGFEGEAMDLAFNPEQWDMSWLDGMA